MFKEINGVIQMSNKNREIEWVAYIVYSNPSNFSLIFRELRLTFNLLKEGRISFNFYSTPHIQPGSMEFTDEPHVSVRLPIMSKELEYELDRLSKKGIIKSWKTQLYNPDEKIKTAYEIGSNLALYLYELLDKYNFKLDDIEFRTHLFHGFMDSSGFYKHYDEAEIYLDILKGLLGRFKADAEIVENLMVK